MVDARGTEIDEERKSENITLYENCGYWCTGDSHARVFYSFLKLMHVSSIRQRFFSSQFSHFTSHLAFNREIVRYFVTFSKLGIFFPLKK